MVKKAMCLILALAVVLSCINLSMVVSAAGTLKFKVTSSEIQNGKVTATVSITENPGLISYVLALKYDKTKFSAVYNTDSASAVADKKLFGTSMDEITSNSSGLGVSATENLDYITAVATTSGSNVTQTGELFSIEFNVLDSDMTVFPSELVVKELFTYNPSDASANDDGQAVLNYEITNSDGVYIVRHHKQLATGDDEPETEVLTAPVGSEVTATPKVYDSHTFDSLAENNVLTGTVDMAGTLVLDCYYNINNYTITYDYQGGTPETVASNSAKHGEYVTLPDSGFSKTDYEFGGWYTKKNGEGEKFTSTTPITKDITLYAYWTPKPTYSVKHYKEELDGTYPEYEADTEIIIANTGDAVSAQPKSYDGFEEDVSRRKDEDVVKSDSSTVLEFYYKRKTFEVKFYDAEGNQFGETQTVKYQGSATAPTAPDKASTAQYDYTFKSWDKSFNNVTENLDIYPEYNSMVRKYLISYNYSEPTFSGESNKEIEYGSYYILPPENTFSKINYDFKGWFTDLNDEASEVTEADTVTGAVTLYAKWELQPTYRVEHYIEGLNGEYSIVSEDSETFHASAGTSITADLKSYDGFEENTSHSDRLVQSTVAADSSTVLKRYYSRKLFTVKFYDDIEGNGSVFDTQNVRYQDNAIAPTAPDKASTAQYDYTFTGWSGSFDNVTENLDIYPVFDENLKSYTVTYDYNGSDTEGIPSQTANYGDTIPVPQENTFSKVDHNFAGWYTLIGGVETPINGLTVTGDITIIAKWTEMPRYKVEHYKENLNGGYDIISGDTEYIVENAGTDVMAAPKSYTGFVINNELSVLSGNVAADSSTTLKVYYDREEYTVTFYDGEGGIHDEQIIKYEGSAIRPQDPAKTSTAQYNYTFLGWLGVFDNVTDNLDIYPDFDEILRSYTVTYDYQGAAVYSAVYSNTLAYGTNVIIPDRSGFDNAGYNFMGWFTSANGEGTLVTSTDVVEGDIALYAYWEMPSYRVEYYTENLDGSYSEYENDEHNALIGSTVSTDEKSYTGFELDALNENNVLSASVASDSSTVLKAYYKRLTYTVIYDYRGATTSGIANNTFKYGQNIAVPNVSTFSKDGYTFLGWYTMPEGEGVAVGSDYTVTSDITVFAAWQQNPPPPPATAVYKVVRYQENLDGTYSATTENQSGIVGETVAAEITSIAGFVHDASNAGNVLSAAIASDGSTVLAVYYKRNVYTVTFDYQSATTSGIANNTFKHGQTIALPDNATFSRTGYTFDGWYTEANKAGTKIDSTYAVTSNIALYAGWTVVSNPGAGLGGGIVGGGGGGAGGAVTLTVKFNSNGGSEVESIKVEQGAKVSEPAAPTKDGYVFAGWYIDKALKNKYNFDNTVKAGMTLYAAWTEAPEEDKGKEEQDNKDDETDVSQPESEIAKVLNTNPGVTYIQGDDKGNFNPENKITRAEVSVMIYRLLLDTNIATETSFLDIPHDEWYSLQVKTLAAKGIIKGYDDGCFYPSRNVTRAEFATILSRLVQLENGDEIFPDVSADHWAFDYITTAYKNGWITGYDNGEFGPDMNLSRAEAVTILCRVLGKTVTDGNECKFPDVSEDHWAYNYICASSN